LLKFEQVIKEVDLNVDKLHLSRLACIFILLTSCYSTLAIAQEPGELVPAKSWGVGIAVGYGERTSPLVGVENLSIWVLPELYYYGERFYFDNGRLGWQLTDDPQWVWSLVSRINPERSYFSDRYLGNWLEDPFGAEEADTTRLTTHALSPSFIGGSAVGNVNVRSVSERDWSIDAGVQVDWYAGDGTHIRLDMFADALQRHGGFNSQLSITQLITERLGTLSLRAELTYKSADLVDYYYGVTRNESALYAYEGEHSIEPALGLAWHLPLNTHWRILGLYKHTWLGQGIKDSPLTNEKAIQTWFLGVGYRF